MVSGSISLLTGFFSPFPHGTAALSVAAEYLALIVVDPDSNRISRVPPYSGTASQSLHHFAYGAFTLFDRLSQNRSAIMKIYHSAAVDLRLRPCGPTTPVKLVWALPISLAATFGISFDFFSRVT